MPLFKDNESLCVVYRQHEYNTEVLDGKLTKIDDTSQCTVLQHIPNNSWSYNVIPLSTNYADIIWEQYSTKIIDRPKDPEVFITAVLADDVNNYIKLNKYSLLSRIQEVKKENDVYVNIKPPEKSSFTKNNEMSIDTNVFNVKLVRDSENITYKFKQPFLR